MEDILEAIKHHNMVTIKRNDGKKDDIYPVFIHRNNDYYYFYYHYKDNTKLYHYRFDNISDVIISDIKDTTTILKKDIIKTINESTNSYSKNDSTQVSFKVLNKSDNMEDRIKNDFPNAILTKEGFSVIVSINNNFFSKVFAYGEDIKISDKTIAKKYKEYLSKVLAIYH